MKINTPALNLSLDDTDLSADQIRTYSLDVPYISYYRLVHFLNKTGEWNFAHTRQQFSTAPDTLYDIYRYDSQMDHVQWFLLSGVNEKKYFITALGPGASYLDEKHILEVLNRMNEVVFMSVPMMLNPEIRKKFYYFLMEKELLLTWE